MHRCDGGHKGGINQPWRLIKCGELGKLSHLKMVLFIVTGM